MCKHILAFSLGQARQFFLLRSQILLRLGLNDQKPGADSKNIYINVLFDIGCHRMTSYDI